MKRTFVLLLVMMLGFCVIAEAGDGSSYEEAVVIKYTGDYFQSIGQEYRYIEEKYGVMHRDWEPGMQSQVKEGDRFYDVIEFKLIPSGEKKGMIFDITDLIANSPFASPKKES